MTVEPGSKAGRFRGGGTDKSPKVKAYVSEELVTAEGMDTGYTICSSFWLLYGTDARLGAGEAEGVWG